ncbi:MAG: DUF4175 family protein [Flavobacteriales bacterium]
MGNRADLLKKLDGYIRKHHRNALIRGALLTAALGGFGWLLAVVLEQLGRFGVAGRTVVFWTFVVMFTAAVVGWVVRPLLALLGVGKRLSRKEASRLIGEHFPEVADKLLNTLQLQDQVDEVPDTSLLLASIDQRISEMAPIPFLTAISIRENLQYLRYALPPMLVFLGLWFWQPAWVKEPSHRLIQHRSSFVAPPPFTYELLSTPLQTPQNNSFDVEVRLTGEAIPGVVSLVSNGASFRMRPTQNPGVFAHRFPNIQSETTFHFRAAGYDSQPYTIQPLNIPGIGQFTIQVDAPDYTDWSDNTSANAGDIRVPEGSKITWQITPRDADVVRMRLGINTIAGTPLPNQQIQFRTQAIKSDPYWLIPENKALGAPDSIRYALEVIRDQHPAIRVEEELDSTLRSLRYFYGTVQDDYGFSRLRLSARFLERPEDITQDLMAGPSQPFKIGETIHVELPEPSGRSGDFVHRWDMKDIGVLPGDVVEYWFEVFDNDAVNGPKSTRSKVWVHSTPTADEIKKERKETGEALTEDLEQRLEDAQDLREELDELKATLRKDDKFDWQDERAVEAFLKKQEELQRQLDELRQQTEQMNLKEQEFSPEEERILEKQEQLQELMENVMSDELQAIYDEMRRLMEDMEPDMLEEMNQQLENMDVDQESLEKELDRALEQFKQLEWEVGMEDVMKELEELAQKQQDLADDTRYESEDNEKLKERQEELNDAFEKLTETYEELEKKNSELENPNPMMDISQEKGEIQENMKEGAEQLEKEKNKKAADQQQQAADDMKQMAQQMQQMQMEMQQESAEEDMEALRALLENIISLSFDEEFVMADLRQTAADDPRYTEHGQTQRRLQDDSKMVEDSLFALSKRIPQLSSMVNREIGLVNHHMEKALGGFGDRMTDEITANQQYVMTSFNNLALMLDEALQQMQQSMAESQPGSGNCQKPGGNGKPSPSPSAGDMKRMQDALGKKLEQMKKSMGEGANSGSTPSEKRKLSKELAEMAAQQRALRQMAEKKGSELNETGQGAGNGFKQIAAEMEALERQLVNREIDLEAIERQRDIMTRLLEAEEAERIRGEKEERKSRTGRDLDTPPPPSLQEYLDKKESETEWLRTIPPELEPYYRERVNEYFNTLGNDIIPQP